MDAESYQLKQNTFANLSRLSTAIIGFAISFPIAAYLLFADVPYLRIVALVVLFPCAIFVGAVIVATLGYLLIDIAGFDLMKGAKGGFAKNMPLLNRFILSEVIR
jgi:hypothetical protein